MIHVTHLTHLTYLTHWTYETQISPASEPPTTHAYQLAGSQETPFFFLCLQLFPTP